MLIHGILVIFAVWPVAQIALVLTYDANPWKFAGWGMYSAPRIPRAARIFCRTPDEVGRYELRTLRPEFDLKYREFLIARRELGRLARPDALARAVLDYYPAIVATEILVIDPRMDPRTGLISDRATTYDYPRREGE